MRFAAARTKINAPFAVKQAGHITQKEKLWVFKDDLYARLLFLEDDNVTWLHVSADNLGLELCVQQTIEAQLCDYFNKQIHVTLSYPFPSLLRSG